MNDTKLKYYLTSTLNDIKNSGGTPTALCVGGGEKR